MFNRNVFVGNAAPQPMEIGNVERGAHYRGKAFKKGVKVKTQRQKDLDNNACFTCHKPGCRPWKHRDNVDTNNAEADNVDQISDSESEN